MSYHLHYRMVVLWAAAICFGDQTIRIFFLCVLRTTFKVSDPILNNMPPLPNTEARAISRGCLAASTLSTLHFLHPKFPVKDKMLRYGKWVHQTGSSASLGHLTHRFKKKSRSSTQYPPEGRLMQLLSRPSFSSLLFLKWPFLFFTLGFSWYTWWMMMFSSRSTMSISLSASSCSRLLSCSSCSLCSSAARAKASSQDLSSCDDRVDVGKDDVGRKKVRGRVESWLALWFLTSLSDLLMRCFWYGKMYSVPIMLRN